MKLMCAVCSGYIRGNPRKPGRDNIIANIPDPGSIAIPLHYSMFESIDPERNIQQPWLMHNAWDTMFCPNGGRHLPWPLSMNKYQAAIKNGGPGKILTDEGIMEVSEYVPKHQCPQCGAEYVNKSSLGHHMREKHHGE